MPPAEDRPDLTPREQVLARVLIDAVVEDILEQGQTPRGERPARQNDEAHPRAS